MAPRMEAHVEAEFARRITEKIADARAQGVREERKCYWLLVKAARLSRALSEMRKPG